MQTQTSGSNGYFDAFQAQVQRAGQPLKTSGDGRRTLHNVFLDGTRIGFHVVEMIDEVIDGEKREGERVAFLGFDHHADEKDCFANASQLLEKGNFLVLPATSAPAPAAANSEQPELTEAPSKASAKRKRPGGKKARKEAQATAKGGASKKTSPGEASQPTAAMQ